MNESPNERRRLPRLSNLGAQVRCPVALALAAAAYGLREGLMAQKRAEREALEGRTKLEAALSSMTDAVAIVGVDGHFIDHNPAWLRCHRFASWEGGSRTLASARQHVEIFMADGAPAPVEQRPVSRAMRGETSAGVEHRPRCKDSGETWVGSYSFAPVRLAGEVTPAVVVARDVTQQRRTALLTKVREVIDAR
jgi:PAS domain S-box-containing protein